MRHFLTVGLVLAIVAPLSAYPTIVQHLPYGPDPQFAGDPNQPDITWCIGWSSWNGRSKPILKGWLEDSCGVTSAVFDKAELQAAIDGAVAAHGSWRAEILVSQYGASSPNPIQFNPIVGSAGVGSSTGFFAYQDDGANDHALLGDPRFTQTHRNGYTGPLGTIPPGGQWTGPGVQGRFESAVVAGLSTGVSALDMDPDWTQFLWTDIVDTWTTEIEATDIVEHYVNSDALLLFAGATGDVEMQVYSCNQWGGAADIRVRITPEPVSLALLAMGGLVALRRRR